MIQHIASRIVGVAGVILVGVILAASAPNVFAQSSNGRAEDEAAVRQAGKDYLQAIERGDGKAIADFWTADGTYTDEAGHTLKVRELVEKNAAGGNAARPQMKVSNVKIRFVSGDVAIEDGECETLAAGAGAPMKGRYTALWVRQNGHWKLDNLRETRMESAGNGSGEVASLGAFVGDWSGDSNKMTIHETAKWDATKKFLRRENSISGGKASLSGTQMIGWDPVSQHIKSWMFNDDGSYGEGTWSLEGNVWMELSSRTFPDGKTATAIQIYKFPDKNTMVWKVIRGSIDGQPTEDFEVTMKRGK